MDVPCDKMTSVYTTVFLGITLVIWPVLKFLTVEPNLDIQAGSMVFLCVLSLVLLRTGFVLFGKVIAALMVPVISLMVALQVDRSLDLMDYCAWAIAPALFFTKKERAGFYFSCTGTFILRVCHVCLVGGRTDLMPPDVALSLNLLFCAASFGPIMIVLFLFRHYKGMQEEARAANARAKTLARASHEMRTPLNSMLALVDLLLATELSPEQHRWLSLLETCGVELRHVVNDTLDLAKLESNCMELAEAPTSINDVVEHTVETLTAISQSKGNVLRFSCPPDLTVAADSFRLRQVLRNLVGNALKFCSNGDVSVDVTAAPVSSRSNHDVLVTFTVSDTGVGIPSSMLSAIFNVYTQCNNTGDAWVQGTGLGLPICKQLVECMGGRIYATSSEMGSTFTAEIPFRRCANVVTPAPVKEVTVADPRLNVLLVDDNNLNLLVLRKLIQKAGHRLVKTCGSGAEALERIRKDPSINVVLVDLHMPGMTGVETAVRIKQTTGRRAPVIYAVSASVEEDERKACLAAMDGFLPKPISWALVKETMADVTRLVASRNLCVRRVSQPAVAVPMVWAGVDGRMGGGACSDRDSGSESTIPLDLSSGEVTVLSRNSSCDGGDGLSARVYGERLHGMVPLRRGSAL